MGIIRPGFSHVLLVDDEDLILESLTSLLEFDYNVHTTVDTFEALQILKQYPIKIIMSDQRMPHMFGHELLREAKKISPNTIRVLLTGYSDLDSIMKCVNAGEIFRYINKPWNPDNILNIFKLGVQLYDKLNELTTHHKQPVASTPSVSAPAPQRDVHIEVEEKNMKVMFVGYTSDELQALTHQLSKQYEILAADSVDSAFKEIARKPVSVIVSDVKMEDVDSVEFLHSIKQEYPHIVTVILTDILDAKLAVRAINELNVYKYLVKPVAASELETVIQEATSKSKLFISLPQSNLYHLSQKITPSNSSATESALRLKLRAAQAALMKNKS